MAKAKQKTSYLPLFSVVTIFCIGTLLDTVSMRYFGWAIGGLGSVAAAVMAVFYMYRYTQKRISITSLIHLLRLVKPRLPTVWDKIFVIAVLVTAIVVPLVVSSGIRNDITSSIFLYAISAAIIPSAIEELINRGFIQSSLERLRYAQWLVIIVSSLIFSLSHYPVNPEAVPVTLVAGILFGIMTVRTKSVILPFLIHGVWNFLATLVP